MNQDKRESGVEYLGPIPDHWQVRPAVTLARVLTSTVDKKSYDNEVPVKLCNYTDVYYGTEITDSTGFMIATASRDQIARFAVQAGDVPFTKDSETADDIGVPAYIPHDMPGTVYGYHLSVYRPLDARYGRFLRYVLESDYAKTHFATKTPGVTRVGLSQATVRYFRIPTPPANEAVAIADFLDRETAQIDAFIAKNEELIALLTERRATVIDRLVFGLTSSVEPDRHVPDFVNQQAALRGFFTRMPPGWAVGRFNAIVNRLSARNHGSQAVMRSLKVTGEVVQRTSTQNPDEANIPRYLLVEPGDLVVNPMWLVGGAVGVSSVHGAVSPDYRVFRPRPAINGRYLHHVLRSRPYRRQYELFTRAETTFDRRVSQTDLDRLPIPLPCLEEQVRIASDVDRELERIDSTVVKANEAMDLARERRGALISAAVMGKIDVGVNA